MPDSVSFTVYGEPKPAGSKRHVGKGIIIDANAKSGPWKKRVAQVAGEMMRGSGLPLFRGAIEASFVFYRRRPKGHFTKAGKLKPSAPVYPLPKPDVLKLARAVEDGLIGVVYNDDSQIVAEHLDKRYGEPERVEIVIREML